MRKNNFNTLKNVSGVGFCFIQSEGKQSFGEWVSMHWVGQGSLVWNNQAFRNGATESQVGASVQGCTSHAPVTCSGRPLAFPASYPRQRPVPANHGSGSEARDQVQKNTPRGPIYASVNLFMFGRG